MTFNTLPDTHPEGVPKRPRKPSDKSSNIATTRNRSSAMIREQQELLQSLDQLSIDPEERELQRQTYTALRESLRRGEKSGIIKLPTGTGKTWVFANMLKIFQKNGLILVPRTDLYTSTVRDLREVGFQENEIRLISEESGVNSEERMLSLLTDPSIDWSSGHNVAIMTYQSLTSMFKNNPEIGAFMKSHFDMIIEDEAHRSLGKKTKKAVKNVVGDLVDDTDTTEIQELTEEMDIEEIESVEIQAEEIAEHILGLDDENFQNDHRYNYKFTATPDLLGKSVSDESEYIFYATFEQAVRTRAIILPQYVDMGSAYLRSGDFEKWRVKDIEQLSDSENDEFIDENGLSIRDKIIDAYIEKKEKHSNSLPAVAFAGTIKHAETLVKAMRAKGIKAERVTSAKGDISSEEATKRMDRGELDVIVTVTKVSEGFDYAPLSCALWFAPVLSPAKITQGNGRISRDAFGKIPEEIIDPQGRIIPSPAAYIIAPSEWYSGSKSTKEQDDIHDSMDGDNYTDPENDEDPLEDQDLSNNSSKKLSRIGNFYELLVSQGEFDHNTLPAGLRHMISLKDCLVCEVGEEIEIDGVMYVGVAKLQEIMGLNGHTILDNARKDADIIIKQGRQKSGFSIQLIPKTFIESFLDTCESGEEREINGVIYVGVVTLQEVMGLRGYRILNSVKKNPNIIIKQGRQKSGHSIRLIPKSFIHGLLHTCEIGEEKEIDGVIYVGVTKIQEIMGLNGQIILDNAKKNPNIIIKQGRQKSGRSIQLIPRRFIESLLDTCEIGEEKEIDGVIYVGVVTLQEVMGLKGSMILRNAEKNPNIIIKQGRQKSGLSIQLIPKNFIQQLIDTCEIGEEKEIDGVVYIGVTTTQEIMGLNGEMILNNAKRDSITMKKGRQKSGKPVQLIPKRFIESLLDTCESGEEKEIDGAVYIGVITTQEIMGLKGFTILNNAKKDSNITIKQGRQKSLLSIQLIPKTFIEGLLQKKK